MKEVKSILATGHSNDEIDIALLALSRLLALTHDFSQGEAAVDSMENPYQQSEALVSLMNEAARVQDLARAQHFMHRTEALAYRAIDYAGRAHILAILALGVNDLGWSDTARRFADRIDDGYLRAHLLVKLAANGNLHDRRRFLAAALRYGTLEISLPLIADTDPTILDTLTDEFDKASPKPLI